MKYQVIESKVWRRVCGRSASVYGAAPWVSEADRPNWSLEAQGWNVQNPHNGQVGLCRPPFKSRAEAESYAESHNPPRSGYGD